MKVSAVALIAASLTLGGCASILNDPTQKINVTTTTASAIKGTVNGMPFTTPTVLDIKRAKQDLVFVTDAPGCNPRTVEQSSVDTVFWINILSGGVFGSSTDYSTDKMWRYSENVALSCKN